MGLNDVFLPAVTMDKRAAVAAKYYPSRGERISAYSAVQSLLLLVPIQLLDLLAVPASGLY